MPMNQRIRKTITVRYLMALTQLWNFSSFTKMSVIDRHGAVRKQGLCYECLGKGHAIRDGGVKML